MMGDFDKALEWRRRGAPDKMICSYIDMSLADIFRLSLDIMKQLWLIHAGNSVQKQSRADSQL